MFKLSVLIGTLGFFFSSWLAGFQFPRLAGGNADYLLMPLLGYLSIIAVAQIAARFCRQNRA